MISPMSLMELDTTGLSAGDVARLSIIGILLGRGGPTTKNIKVTDTDFYFEDVEKFSYVPIFLRTERYRSTAGSQTMLWSIWRMDEPQAGIKHILQTEARALLRIKELQNENSRSH